MLPRMREILVVPTTHWDRDWYWPFERFRVKLIELFAAAKVAWAADPTWRFSIDGQAIPVEDYLEAIPEDADMLMRLGAEKRFAMGPVYVQSDTYCTGGEAFIRNLLIGREISLRFGALQGPLYLPDSFGHVPELPMLAAGFGIRTILLMRGNDGVPGFPHDARFARWSHADGSEVRLVRLRDGYGNAANLGLARGEDTPERKASGLVQVYDPARACAQLTAAANRQLEDGQGGPFLMLAGSDHVIPRAELGEVLRAATDGNTIYRFADLNDVDRALWARDPSGWHHHRGELHAVGAGAVLGGTVSARIYLKLDNARAERALVDVAEPADAMALLVGIDDPAAAVLRTAWRRLLKAHPHDDITGCSVDAVHRENEQHIACALQAADALRRRMIVRLIAHYGGQLPGDDRQAFIAFDTSGHAGMRRFTVELDLEGRREWGDYHLPRLYAIRDEQGQAVPFRELARESSSEHPHTVLRLEVRGDLAPFAPRRFVIDPIEPLPRPEAEAEARSMILENERLSATVRADGSVDLVDLRSGAAWNGLGRWSDQGDVGNEYDFVPLPDEAERIHADLAFAHAPTAMLCGGGMRVVRMTGELRLPADASSRRIGGALVAIPVIVDYSLAPGEAWLTCRIRLRNRAKEMRLRWNATLPAKPATTRAGLKFTEVTRPAGAQPNHDGKLIPPEHPADAFVAVPLGYGISSGIGTSVVAGAGDAATGGLAVFARAPVNYEIVDDNGGARLAITLVRAVGWLGSGLGTLTPEAQCLERDLEHVFALRPYAAEESADLLAEALAWRHEALTGLIWGYNPPVQPVDHEPVIALAPGAVRVSACKRSHDRERVIVRLHNASALPAIAELRVRADRVCLLGLDEEPRGDPLVVAADGAWRVPVPPQGLVTLGLETARG